MHRPFLHPSVPVLAVALALASCSKMPDESDAQEAYAAKRATIDDVARSLSASLATLSISVPVVCEDAEAVAAANDPARNAAYEACSARRGDQRARAVDEWRHFRSGIPASLVSRHPDMLGLKLNAVPRGESMEYPLNIGVTSPSVVGTPADRGFGRGDRKVGYHLYQTAVEFAGTGRREGDGVQRPGIEVVFTLVTRGLVTNVTLVLLTEENTTDQWRAAQLERLLAR
jgi:hypothetical protein